MLSLFGPEKDKQRLCNASRALYDCVYLFVSSSNTMFRMLNQYLGTEFPNVVVRESLSIKENLQLLMSALKDMQETVELKDRDVQQRVSGPLYAKIVQPISPMNERVQLVKEMHNLYGGSFATICGPIAAVLLKNGDLPEKLQSALRVLGNSHVMSLRVGDLLMTHDEIAKALPEPSTTSASPAAVPEVKNRSQSLSSMNYSLNNFLRVVLRGRTPKNSFEMAAGCLEDVVKVLKPACENFKSIVKRAEEYVTLIIDKLQ
ncbi:uncharacterized protein LOC125434646 [Sphaerodactylus townsendi]|uniref:uncharacterized protein LOC125434646 n=1 Tax=Sphaerodactylus townsendi TaxID=933632 RepID=UPI0020274FC4|nr:uncharacterized protein LOC125434646 [Sphaerodactylus townsendi]XP_048356142.1 uncharacterized protein LOC125434646 [Sphaerodactylus townsendi]XP_048356143.1 uncharacterized protein LOC125434646 [Sphaerodactylus townsendi]XP_048356144.1 uncharacterized protein LOC125434646 [Sphaerodactylus townsendi]XP_048356145.1 uncharacterized protein LOC125434646 [Sphaerodactylus townsendi]